MSNPSILLWPEGAPGAAGTEEEDVPTLTPFLPEASKSTGAGIVICPGGGYAGLAPHEGRPIAEWLNGLGIAAFVLKYRLCPRHHHPAPLQDASRAIRLVRHRAGEWNIDPKRVGILGFSAGGHLASTAGTHFDAGEAASLDPVQQLSSRPDLMVLVYPVISMAQYTHIGSRVNLLGDTPSSELIDHLSSEKQVTSETPPAFLVHILVKGENPPFHIHTAPWRWGRRRVFLLHEYSVADDGVACENSLLFASALRAAGVLFELHVFDQGPHGFGLGGEDPVLSKWPILCAGWMKQRGFANC